MERLKFKTLSFPAKSFTRVLAALGILLALAACNEGGSGGGVATVGINGCQDCGALNTPMTLLTYNSQSTNGAVKLENMALYGSYGAVYNWYGTSPAYYYNGPVATQGVLRVDTPQWDLSGRCHLPVGTYHLRTYNVGQMQSSAGVFSVLSFPSIRSTTADIELRIGITNGGQGFIATQNRLNAYVEVVRVGGQMCNGFSGTFN